MVASLHNSWPLLTLDGPWGVQKLGVLMWQQHWHSWIRTQNFLGKKKEINPSLSSTEFRVFSVQKYGFKWQTPWLSKGFKVRIKLYLRTGSPKPGIRSYITLYSHNFASLLFCSQRFVLCLNSFLWCLVAVSSHSWQADAAIWVKCSLWKLQFLSLNGPSYHDSSTLCQTASILKVLGLGGGCSKLAVVDAIASWNSCNGQALFWVLCTSCFSAWALLLLSLYCNFSHLLSSSCSGTGSAAPFFSGFRPFTAWSMNYSYCRPWAPLPFPRQLIFCLCCFLLKSHFSLQDWK